MAIRFAYGFDQGLGCQGAGCPAWQTGSGGTAADLTAQSTTKRSGSFALKCNTTTSQTAFIGFGGIDPTTGGQVALAAGDIFIRFYFLWLTKPTTGEEVICRVRSAGNVALSLITLQSDATLAAFVNGVVGHVGVSTTVLTTNVWYRIEYHYTAGASGKAELKINGNVEFTATGSYNVATVADISIGKSLDIQDSRTIDVYYDDMMFSDTAYPGPGRVIELRPASNGTYQDWLSGPSPQDFTQINEIPIDVASASATYIQNSGGATNQVSTFGVDNAITAGISGKVKCVIPYIWCREDTNVTSDQKLRFRVGGTNFDTLSFNGNTNYQLQGKLYEQNPATSANWKRAALLSAEVGPLQANAVAMRCGAAGMVVAFNDEEPGDAQPLLSLLGAGA